MAEVKELDPKVIERLNKIDWDGLEKSVGITRKMVEAKPAIAAQLAYQQHTDLIFGSNKNIAGMFSLRAVPGKGENDPWTVKAYTMENEKKPGDRLFLYGNEITSQSAKDALLERTSWENSQGKKVFGYANANAGRPIAIMREGENGEKTKEHYLVSLHQPTNRIVGIPVSAVKGMLLNEDGTSRGTTVYGVKLSDDQVNKLCEGKAVVINGCKTAEGKEFNTAVQFDVARRQIVASHPTWLKEAQRAGVDVLGNAKEAAQEATQSEAKGKTRKAAEAPKVEKESKLKI